MKKTLITLMALAGVSCAYADGNLIWSADMSHGDYSITNGENFSLSASNQWASNDFTTMPGYVYVNGSSKVSFEGGSVGLKLAETFTVSMDCKLTGVGSDTQTSYYLMKISESASWEFGVVYDTNSGAITLAANNGTYTLSDVKSYGSFDITDISNVTFTMAGELLEPGAMSVYVNGTLAASGTMAGGNRHDTTNVGGGLTFLRDRDDNQGAIKGFVGGVSAVHVYSGIVIPEPTTATLSLLALAGLAARRRRK